MDVIYEVDEVDEITDSINSISLEQQLYASGYIQPNNTYSDMQSDIQYDLVEEMDALSIKDLPDFAKDQLVIDLFQHNLDIYDSSTIDKYEKKMYLDIPNVYCNGISYGLDDEDFIHTKLKLPSRIKYIINGNKEEADFAGESGIPSYVINFIEKNKINLNFYEIEVDSNNIYAKIIYIYQYINYYYNDLKYLSPLERINHIPNDMLIWVDNITTILRNTIDNSGISIDLNESNSNSNIYINTLDIFRESRNIKEDYVKSLIYGLNLIVCHLKMILNHHKTYQIPLYRMDETHINKFFNILNNLCIIMIYIKLV